MTSKERMLTVLNGGKPDHTPCCFFLFSNLYLRSRTEQEFVEKQLEMGLDTVAHVGHLNHTLHLDGMLHPDVKHREWVEQKGGVKYFCRRLDTPKGPLTSRVRQYEGWPKEGDFPLLKDWIVPRAEEPLVKPEQDLEKVRYLFGPFKDRDIAVLRESAAAAKKLAERHGLLQIGGWKGYVSAGLQIDPGTMGCDAMAWLSGYEEVMTLAITRPEIIREYAQIIHAWNLKQIGIYLEVTGAELIIRRAWYETTEFWTPEAYRTIIAPTIKREADLVHQAGKKYGYIITSAFLPLVDDILAAGVDVLIGLDPKEGKGTDLRQVKAKFAAKKRTIWGGVSGAVTIETGTKTETEQAVSEALQLLGANGGFILAPMDNVREDTPLAWQNTQAFIDAWKKHR